VVTQVRHNASEVAAVLTKSRRIYIRRQLSKLLSPESLRRLARDPSIAFKHLQTVLSNHNSVECAPDAELKFYRDSIAALANFVAAPKDSTFRLDEGSADTRDLAALFRKHGSDKASWHEYHRIYGSLLSGRRKDRLAILEIGLGSNNIDVPGNMWPWGKPGGSLRAFRDWAPNSSVYGADVDKRILFNEERISTFWVDQTDVVSLVGLRSKIDTVRFDLIIDDGLHVPHANFNTLSTLMPLLKDDGVFVVEDILPSLLPIWRVVQATLPEYETHLISSKGYVFVLSSASGRNNLSQRGG
jgi:hypothetical protein